MASFDIVEKAWREEVRGSPLFEVTGKLRNTKGAFKIRNKLYFRKVNDKIKELTEWLDRLQTRPQTLQILEEQRQFKIS